MIPIQIDNNSSPISIYTKPNQSKTQFLLLYPLVLSFPSSEIKMEMKFIVAGLRRPRSNAFDDSFPKKVVELPYDILNVIFEYLSHITDSGWILNVNNSGKLSLFANPECMAGIDYINRFKQGVRARYMKLHIMQWMSSDESMLVDALEQPHLICDQKTTEENYQNGFENKTYCCTYTDPKTKQQMIAYVESRHYYAFGYNIFKQGCVYGESDNTYVVAGYAHANPNIPVENQIYDATIQVNSLNMVWDVLDEDEEEIDLESLPPLHMYM